MERHFQKIPKRRQPGVVYQNVENFVPKVFFLFNFARVFLEVSVGNSTVI